MTKNPIPLTVRGLRAEYKSKQEIFLFSSNGIFLYSQTLKVKKNGNRHDSWLSQYKVGLLHYQTTIYCKS